MLERVGGFVLLCKWHSFIQLSLFISFTFNINTSYVAMLLKVSRKNIPGKLKDIINCVEGEMNGLLISLHTDM